MTEVNSYNGNHKIYVNCGTDADSIFSAVLYILAKGLSIDNIVFQDEFGVDDLSKPSEVMLDSVPYGEYKGLVYDHHPQHKDKEIVLSPNRTYQLHWRDYPTTKIIYDLVFKPLLLDQSTLGDNSKNIYLENAWKVAAGLCGDGQPELIPIEIWKQYPELLEETESVYEKSYGYGTTVYKTLVVNQLASGINAAARLGMPDIAIKVAYSTKTPLDLVQNEYLHRLKGQLSSEIKNATKYARKLDLGMVRLWIIKSKFRIESRVATEQETQDKGHKTIVVYNETTKRLSSRGVLTPLIVSKLSSMGIVIGGHAKYSGGRLSDEQDESLILKGLRDLLK